MGFRGNATVAPRGMGRSVRCAVGRDPHSTGTIGVRSVAISNRGLVVGAARPGNSLLSDLARPTFIVVSATSLGSIISGPILANPCGVASFAGNRDVRLATFTSC